MSEINKDLMELFIRLERLLRHYQIYNMRYSGPFGNPHRGQGRVLSILKLQPEISQKELGYLLDMRNQSLGELLGKLEHSGYITRTPSEQDRRTTNIKLTPEGAAAASKVDAQHDAEELFACLSDEEQARLGAYLERIIAQLERRMEGAGQETAKDSEVWFGVGFGRHGHPHGGREDIDPRAGLGRFYGMRHGFHDRGRGGRPYAERFDPDHDDPMPERDGHGRFRDRAERGQESSPSNYAEDE